jgi:uncharacterized protein YfbU (UPF0304 family)
MKLSRIERWIISNQLRILEILDPKQKDSYSSTQKILENGFEYLYSSQIEYIYPDHETMSEEDGKLVVDILDMFNAIKNSLKSIDPHSGLETNHLTFSGFDGNYEGKFYSFAKFYCTEFDGGRFKNIGKGVDNFNSHASRLDTYKRMLKVWNSSPDKYALSEEQLIKISEAAIHPSNR